MLDRQAPRGRDPERRPAAPPPHRTQPARSTPNAAPLRGELSSAEIRSIIAGLPELVLLTDDRDRIRLTNPSADALFADRPVRSGKDLVSRFEPVPSTARGRDDAEGTAAVVTVRPRHQPNSWFTLETFPLGRGAPGPAGAAEVAGARGGGSVFVLRDVTESLDLRPEREAFLSIVSHELRTPITTIYAGTSVLARPGALSRPASQNLARDISAEAARLYDLVEDLLVIARLERRILDPVDEPVLLQRVLEVTTRILAGRAPDVPFVREGEPDPPPIRGDATYVEQALRDLAVSAVRFGDPDHGVTIGLAHDADRGEVACRVLDRGLPIPDRDLGRVFELPSAAATGRLAVAGIGPFVSRQLVESMGGRVWALNHPDGRVELGFALPVDDRA